MLTTQAPVRWRCPIQGFPPKKQNRHRRCVPPCAGTSPAHEPTSPEGEELWLAAALSIVVMQITKTLHPLSGATALLATAGSAQLKALGYWYVLMPVLLGVLLLLAVALVFNNVTATRSYPTNKHWYKVWRRYS